MTKREEILEAAEALFAEYGFDGTSVRALAAKAGVNVAMISYYFGSKEKLFEALVEYRSAFMRERLQMLMKEVKDPAKRMDKLIEYFTEKIFERHRFHKILVRQINLHTSSDLNKAIAVILMKNHEEIRKIINDGKEKKIFRDIDTEMTIAAIIGTITQSTLSNVLSCRITGSEPSEETIYCKKNRDRLVSFLKELIHSYISNRESIPESH